MEYKIGLFVNVLKEALNKLGLEYAGECSNYGYGPSWAFNIRDIREIPNNATISYGFAEISDIKNTLKMPVWYTGEKPEHYSFSADQTRLAEKLREKGYELEKIGRSGFEARNRYRLRIPEDYIKLKDRIEVFCPFLIRSSVEETLDDYEIKTFKDVYLCSFEQEVIEPLREEIKEEAKKEIREKLSPYLGQDYLCLKYGDRVGLNLELTREILEEEGYGCVWTYKLHGGDHRQNIGPTVVGCWVKRGLKYIRIPAPKERIGKIIGRGGSNIKEIKKELNIKRIDLYPVDYYQDAINVII